MLNRVRQFTVGKRMGAWLLQAVLLVTASFHLATAQTSPTITTEPQNQSGQVGGNVAFTLVASGAAPLTYRWYHNSLLVTNGGRFSGAATPSLQISGLLDSDAGGYQVAVSNQYSVATSRVAFLIINKTTLDLAFDPQVGDWVESLALQLDGRLLLGGYFTMVGGQPRTRLARLLPNGSLDAGFNPEVDYIVNCVALQPDEKILLGGYFDSVGGQPHAKLARLLPDGTPDNGFNPQLNEQVVTLALQADGKILAGGYFNSANGQARSQIARFDANGTLDNSFNPGANGYVYCLTLQPDGRILVGGDFTMLGGQPRNHLARLNADGTLDGTFNPGADNTVTAIAVQADGKILVAGSFGTLGGQPRNHIGRLNSSGTVDSTVFEGQLFGSLLAMTLQADGKIMIGGDFSFGGGQPPWKVARFNPNGQLDTSFDPRGDGLVTSLLIQPTGNFLVGGWYFDFAGQSRSNLVRLDNTSVATENLSHNNSTITWSRGGSGPEVWRTTFERSTNGATWTNLGAGIRIAGGWQLTNLTLSNGDTIRARGFVQGGNFHGSSWYLESMRGPPAFTRQPVSQTRNAGSAVEFTAVAGGTAPIGFRWLKDGVALQDGGGIVGAGTPTLSLSHVLKSNQGNYRVVVTNSQGSVTSVVAVLTVVDPVFVLQPASQSFQAGQAVTLSVGGEGTPPLAYRWRKEGVPLSDGAGISGAASTALTISNLVAADGGNYSAVISNAYGMNTSAVATVTILLPPEITASPSSQSVVLTSNATFSITATGTAPLSYQWQKDGLNLTDSTHITGATSSSLGILGGLAADVGDYRVRVSNAYGSATSVVATLTVLFPPTITLQPTNQSADLAQTITIAASAAGTAPLTYQWRRDGAALSDDGNISGSTAPELMVSSITPAHAGGYDLVVSNSYGSVTSAVAMLNVWLEPVILTQPASQNVIPTRDHTFTVVAKGAAPLGYRWFLDNLPLADGGRLTGAGSAALTIQNVQATDAGGYTVVVSNSWGSVTSSIATLNLASFRYVNVNNPSPVSPYTNWATAATVIQDAINVSGIGDEIQVANGVYNAGGAIGPNGAGNRVYINKPVTVVSVNGPAATTIIGYAGPLVSTQGQRGAYVANGALLAGFTIEAGDVEIGGFFNKVGGGVYCEPGSAVVSNCFILGNRAGEMGGGIMYGKAINCVIAGNYGKNYGGGAAHCELVNCTIVGNISASAGGTFWGALKNSIIFNNQASGISSNWTGSIISNSCTVPIPAGAGNITNDPVFMDYAAGNYRLQFGSPSIDAGENAFVASSLDGDGHARVAGASVDMGAFEHQPAPWIFASPTNQSAIVSSNASLVVVALGDEPLNYRWQKNGTNLADDGRLTGTSAAVFSISPVNVSDAGNYRAFVTNTLGSATSAVATLTIIGPPIISVQPANRTVPAGTNINISVGASGLAALSYQWRFNGGELLAKTNSSLSLTNVQAANGGDYDVVITNIYGAVTSAVATLTVVPAAPTITTQAVSRVASVGENVSFSVVAKGTGPMTCQWQFNGTDLPGGNGFTLFLPNVNSSVAGTYRAAVSNAVGFAFSTNVTLTVSPVVTWGTLNGQLKQSPGTIPVSATNVMAIAAGKPTDAGSPCFALRADGTLVTWGGFSSIPPGTTNVVAISAGGPGTRAGENNLALLEDGTLVHWSATGKQSLPTGATNGHIVAVAAGGLHQLVLRNDGTVFGWGSNSFGQITLPAGATNIIAISAGTSHSLALRADGKVFGWGLDTSGQASALSNAANVVAISAGRDQTLALLSDGAAVGRGVTNSGPQTAYFGPAPSAATNLIAISAGGLHSLVLRADRSVFGWGNTNYGQLLIPPFATNALAIAAGAYHSMALLPDPFAPPIPPRIGRPPLSRAVTAGQGAVFNALAVGGLPLSHQWLRDGVPVAGQTNPSLAFASILPSDAGNYQLLAMNEFGSATSTVAVVTVNLPQPMLKSLGASSNGFSFAFQSILGVLYVVENKNSLDAGTWTELERRFGIGGLELVTDVTAGGAMRIYRVRALFAPSPRVSSASWTGSAVNFNFPTVNGAVYVVQYKTNLDDSIWLELFRQSGTGAPIVVIDPGPPGASRFYRVKVE